MITDKARPIWTQGKAGIDKFVDAARTSAWATLYREFLFRIVDIEVLSSSALGDANKLLGQFAALLLFVSLLFALSGFLFAGARMAPAASLAFTMVSEHFLIATTMLVVGLFAVLSWDSTFPDRRDVLVLGPLPVRARTMFLAKVAAAASALVLAVALLHAFAGAIWPLTFHIQAVAQTVPALTADPTPAPLPLSQMQGDLDRTLHQQLTSGILRPGTGSGLAVGIYQKGDRRIFAYGAAKPDSLFEIGSITKTFTALMLAQMVAQGQVTLDQPVGALLPSGLVRHAEGDEIRLVDLATQHSGLPRGVSGDWQEWLKRHGAGRDPNPPFVYSNFGFGLLGYALGARAGLDYAGLLQQQITGPLGLGDTVIPVSPAQQSRLLQGYDATGHPVPWDAVGLPGSGAIRSTAADLLRYLEVNLHPERAAGSLPQALALEHQARAEGPPGYRIGLAWWLAPDGTWSHGGAMRGFSSHTFFHREGDYAAVVLLNIGPGLDSLPVADLLTEHIRQRLSGQPAVSLDTVFVPAASGFPGLVRWYAAYWFTMLAAGAFMYGFVLGVQGLAAQLLPRRLFLRISGVLQLAAFCLFVGGYFLQPTFGGFASFDESHIRRLVLWVPSYWFLGLMHQLNGSSHPLLAPLARQAWLGLAATLAATGVAYGLSYWRTLRQIVEEPDIAPGRNRSLRLPAFGNQAQTAIFQFSLRTLARSRQHRMILAFYLGVGFALTIFFSKAPALREAAPDAYTSLFAASITMLVLAVAGTRVVFAIPLELRANWVFRIAARRSGPTAVAAARLALLLVSVFPVWLISATFCLRLMPWREAAGHLALLALLGLILVEVCLRGFRKIPFTCSYLPGKSQVNMVFLYVLGCFYGVMFAVKYEQQALSNSHTTATVLALFAAGGALAHWITAAASSAGEDVQFEEFMPPPVMELGLGK